VLNTHPTLALEAYTGKFGDSLYGTAAVNLVNGKLTLVLNKNSTAVLEHWNYDTFRAIYDKKWNGKSYVSFRQNTEGKINEMILDGISFGKL